ncbi:uncharacterized protein LOC129233146 [Uloborus diversus]|uniref:uncharacterized protein LOC129233146 n=1 Tax=Uloborus diversus TaxID=327109 RepID=UPI00240A837C|nr:uncharacterized protein LOC129233146 [Uloborus diversus]
MENLENKFKEEKSKRQELEKEVKDMKKQLETKDKEIEDLKRFKVNSKKNINTVYQKVFNKTSPPTPSSPVAAPSSPVAAPSSPVAAPSSPVAAPSSPVAAPSSPVAAPSSPVAAPSSTAPPPAPAALQAAPGGAQLPQPRPARRRQWALVADPGLIVVVSCSVIPVFASRFKVAVPEGFSAQLFYVVQRMRASWSNMIPRH